MHSACQGWRTVRPSRPCRSLIRHPQPGSQAAWKDPLFRGRYDADWCWKDIGSCLTAPRTASPYNLTPNMLGAVCARNGGLLGIPFVDAAPAAVHPALPRAVAPERPRRWVVCPPVVACRFSCSMPNRGHGFARACNRCGRSRAPCTVMRLGAMRAGSSQSLRLLIQVPRCL